MFCRKRCDLESVNNGTRYPFTYLRQFLNRSMHKKAAHFEVKTRTQHIVNFWTLKFEDNKMAFSIHTGFRLHLYKNLSLAPIASLWHVFSTMLFIFSIFFWQIYFFCSGNNIILFPHLLPYLSLLSVTMNEKMSDFVCLSYNNY